MASRSIGPRWAGFLALVVVLLLSACAPAAAPASPAPQKAEPAKPAAQPPAAQPAKPAAQPVELNGGCSNPPGAAECDALNRLSEVVKEKTKGELTIRNHYQALGSETTLAQSVMSGSVDIGNLSNGNTARFSNAYLIFDLPFMFKKTDDMFKALEGPSGRPLIAQFEKDLGVKMLMPLSFGVVGRDIQTRNKQLKTPADIKGLKIRVLATPIDVTTFKAWGANPTPVDWGQTYAALQQGVVDGEQAILLAVETAKHYEVLKYNIRLEWQPNYNQLFMNAKKFESLSPAHQKALMEASEEVKPWQRQHEADRIKELVQRLTAGGMVIYQPTPEEYAQWTSTREQVWKAVGEEQKGKLDMDLAQRFLEGK